VAIRRGTAQVQVSYRLATGVQQTFNRQTTGNIQGINRWQQGINRRQQGNRKSSLFNQGFNEFSPPVHNLRFRNKFGNLIMPFQGRPWEGGCVVILLKSPIRFAIGISDKVRCGKSLYHQHSLCFRKSFGNKFIKINST
jgi:hypothetical protein